MKGQVAFAAQWPAFSCGVEKKTTTMVFFREGEKGEVERKLDDPVGCFWRVIHYNSVSVSTAQAVGCLQFSHSVFLDCFHSFVRGKILVKDHSYSTLIAKVKM